MTKLKSLNVLLYFLFLFFIAVLLFIGFYAGKIWSVKADAALIKSYHELTYLTELMKMEAVDKGYVKRVFETPVSDALLDSVMYDIPKVPTPFVGSAPRPGKFGTATINEQQFRRKANISIPKEQNVFRIFITGGSVAFGSGAQSDEHTIPAFLEQELNASLSGQLGKKIEVINAACPAWTTTQERIWIENKLSEMQPDMIISFTGHNDAHFNLSGDNTFFCRSYWDHFFNLLVKNAYSATKNAAYPEIVTKGDENISLVHTRNYLSKNVFLINALSKENKFNYVFILQPTLITGNKNPSDYESIMLEKKSKEAYTQKFKEYYTQFDDTLSKISSPGFSYFNFINCFDALEGKQAVYMDGCHFGDRGNKYIAERIADSISPIILKGLQNSESQLQPVN